MKICSRADDVWLNMLSRAKGVYVVPTDSVHLSILPIIGKTKYSLAFSNLEGGNDRQIDAVKQYCIQSLRIKSINFF
jgi:hypothetical protein